MMKMIGISGYHLNMKCPPWACVWNALSPAGGTIWGGSASSGGGGQMEEVGPWGRAFWRLYLVLCFLVNMLQFLCSTTPFPPGWTETSETMSKINLYSFQIVYARHSVPMRES
jgi:hypothetical protein